jgi:acetyl-CoA acetyltransferase
VIMTAAYLYDAVRTRFGRFNGALADVRPDDLASYVIAALLERNPQLPGTGLTR